MNFKAILDVFDGPDKSSLDLFRTTSVAVALVHETHKQRLAALGYLLNAALNSSDAQVVRHATRYKEISELMNFLLGKGDSDARPSDSDTDR